MYFVGTTTPALSTKCCINRTGKTGLRHLLLKGSEPPAMVHICPRNEWPFSCADGQLFGHVDVQSCDVQSQQGDINYKIMNISSQKSYHGYSLLTSIVFFRDLLTCCAICDVFTFWRFARKVTFRLFDVLFEK